LAPLGVGGGRRGEDRGAGDGRDDELAHFGFSFASFDISLDLRFRLSHAKVVSICELPHISPTIPQRSDRLTVAGVHMDFPGFGTIVRKGSGFAFEADA
jgi:hypothetical protein